MDRLVGLLVSLIARSIGWVIGTILGFIIGSVKYAFFSWLDERRRANPKGLDIPTETWFSHAHIVAGSGHGKTQLLQQLFLGSLDLVRSGQGSIIVVDSQGDLINKISHLALMKELADRFVLIDPNDVRHPPALNLFDIGLDRIGKYDDLEQEKLKNSAVAMYEYLFGALFGQEMTGRQELLFGFLARLLMVVPGANIHTLREFIENPERLKPHLAKLDYNARLFFESQFFHPKFDANREQILNRLWGVLENDSLARMFAHERNKVDLFSAMNRGSLILINTAKDLLKQRGCEIFGRFFITLIMQAVQERSAIPENKRMPTFVFIDEAQDYLDDSMEQLFIQARKYKTGLIISHQHLDQLGAYRSTVMTNTAIKIVGGLSARDADVFAREMNIPAEDFQHMVKIESEKRTLFACYIKNQSREPAPLVVPLGLMEQQKKLTDAKYNALLEANRERYCDVVRAEPARLAGEKAPAVQQDVV